MPTTRKPHATKPAKATKATKVTKVPKAPAPAPKRTPPVRPGQAPATPALPADAGANPQPAGAGQPAAPVALGGLEAAVVVLREATEPLNAQDLVRRMIDRGLWTTAGKTPAATIYAAIIREIRGKGLATRFHRAGKGRFTIAS